MIRVYEFDSKSEEVYEVSIEKMNFHRLKWLDCTNPTQEEVFQLEEKIGIPGIDIQKCMDKDERPGITEIENFSMVIFKSPIMTEKHITTTSFGLLVSENMIITIQKKETEGVRHIHELDHISKRRMFLRGSTYIAYRIVENVTDQYFKIMDDIERQITIVEQNVFESSNKKDVQNIFSLKKTLIYFQKALSGNREVLLNINNEYAKNINPSYINNFRYVYENDVQLIDVVATYRDILTSALDIYLTNVSNNLNTVMKKMTAFATIILIPTLITSLYGMNFHYMPELTWKYGYLFAWILIVGVIIILYVYFKEKDWI